MATALTAAAAASVMGEDVVGTFPDALAADDECHGAPGGCALNALQLKLRAGANTSANQTGPEAAETGTTPAEALASRPDASLATAGDDTPTCNFQTPCAA